MEVDFFKGEVRGPFLQDQQRTVDIPSHLAKDFFNVVGMFKDKKVFILSMDLDGERNGEAPCFVESFSNDLQGLVFLGNGEPKQS